MENRTITNRKPKMKIGKKLLLTGMLASILTGCADKPVPQDPAEPVAVLKTPWTDKVDPENVLGEYPRPIMERKDWMSLNGYWQLEMKDVGEEIPFGKDLSRQILVPFAVESYLSGIMETSEHLLYRKVFQIPENWKGKDLQLNLEGVDYHSIVYLNGEKVGEHKGGFDYFSFDLSDYVKEGGEQELIIKVYDPSNDSLQPVGKQVKEPEGIFYTSTTGIWKTVWIEPVAPAHVESLEIIPDIDKNRLSFKAETTQPGSEHTVEVRVFEGEKQVAQAAAAPGEAVQLEIPSPKLWSPETPFLYDIKVVLRNGSEVVDEIASYAAMRKISLGKDKGVTKMFLNNEPYFQIGVLDQGYWPDGLMTPPTEEAYIWDIETFKKMGFNLLRKHAKTESQRWYYLCDKLGMLVWQDMPQAYPHKDFLERQTPEDKKQFEAELENMVENLFNYPSIVMWVVFNEGWGQYDTERLTHWVKELDPNRLVSNASGWVDHKVGDIIDKHSYPGPEFFPPEEDRASVLGEFGGLGLPIKGHLWQESNWGYRNMADSLEFQRSYAQLWDNVWKLKEEIQPSAVVYTQVSDVEGEVNGLVTYDRTLLKLPIEFFRKVHSDALISAPQIENEQQIFFEKLQISLSNRKGEPIYYTLDGTEPTQESQLYSGPFSIDKGLTIKARSIEAGEESAVVSRSFERISSYQQPLQKSQQELQPGLQYSLYAGEWNKLPDFNSLEAEKSGVVRKIALADITDKNSFFGLVTTGYLRIGKKGIYRFELTSDDGSRLQLDKEVIIDHDGEHGMDRMFKELALEEGIYELKLEYFQGQGERGLVFRITDENGKELKPEEIFFHQK